MQRYIHHRDAELSDNFAGAFKEIIREQRPRTDAVREEGLPAIRTSSFG
ncbi:hypothetical protein ACGVWS_11095 [Enterobacteriaceae bacterium LUAb1]